MGRVIKDKSAENACKSCYKEYKAAAKKYREHRNLFQVILGYCPQCGRFFRWSVKTERRHTQYCEEASNWLTACRECHEEDDAYYDDLWNQYYSSI
jgi:cytochrome c553